MTKRTYSQATLDALEFEMNGLKRELEMAKQILAYKDQENRDCRSRIRDLSALLQKTKSRSKALVEWMSDDERRITLELLRLKGKLIEGRLVVIAQTDLMRLIHREPIKR